MRANIKNVVTVVVIVDKQGNGSAYATVGRSPSMSSGSDAHESERQSPATLHAFTDKTASENTAAAESKSKNRGFFDTLDWQDASVPAAASAGVDQRKTDRVHQLAAFEIASTSLDEEFADFSTHRLSANTNVGDVASTIVEPEHSGETNNAETATADLLGGAAWKDAVAARDLFDVGPPEPTNFDLLAGPGTLGNTNGNSSSGFDLLNSNQTFVADFSTCTESSNNPFNVQDTGAVSENSALNDMAADLFGTFDPFTNASVDEKPVSSSNKPSKAADQSEDFLAYVDSARSGKDDGLDLMSGWNASNILSGVSVSMPRASSRPDFGSAAGRVHSEVPRASSSQNMSSTSFGVANGSTRSAAAADPFADIGEFISVHFTVICEQYSMFWCSCRVIVFDAKTSNIDNLNVMLELQNVQLMKNAKLVITAVTSC